MKKQMKIMMVSCSALPYHNSGVAQVIHHVTTDLIKEGHQMYVFTLGQMSGQLEGRYHKTAYKGYEVCMAKAQYTHQNKAHAFTEENYRQGVLEEPFTQYIEEVKPDIVHFHSIQGIGANLIAIAKEKGIKTMVTMHDWWWICPHMFMADIDYSCCNQLVIDEAKCVTCLQRTGYIKEAKIFLEERKMYLTSILESKVDQIFVVSDYLKQYITSNLPHLKVVVNANGVEVPNNYIEKPSEVIRLGFLGGIQPLKGYELLQNACTQLKDKPVIIHFYSVPQVDKQGIEKVWVYLRTQGISGLIRKLKQVIGAKISTQMDRKIVLHPPFKTEEKEIVFSEFDILLSLTIVKESSSLVVREALVRGIPVLSTDSGGPLEVLVAGENSEMIEALTPEAVVAGIEKMLEGNHYKRLKEKIKENPYTYTYKEQTIQLESYYQRVLESDLAI